MMANGHFTHVCETCHAEFPATLNKDGAPRKRKFYFCSAHCRHKPTGLHDGRGRRVSKDCAVCGVPMSLAPSRAKRQATCSRHCGIKLGLANKGLSPLDPGGHCAHCHSSMSRKVRSNRDAGRYCSRDCAFAALGHLKVERAALHRIAYLQRAKAHKSKSHIALEVGSLHCIGERIRARTRKCQGCGKEHVRRRAFSRFCSEPCKAAHVASTKEAYRGSDAYRAGRRKHKSKRRAMIRNAGQVDSIDPIDVFERDKWRCHLCGVKTPPRLRGTIEDRAPELEHIISLSDGGTHTWGNVACSCRKCNREKGPASLGQLGLGIA